MQQWDGNNNLACAISNYAKIGGKTRDCYSHRKVKPPRKAHFGTSQKWVTFLKKWSRAILKGLTNSLLQPSKPYQEEDQG